MSKIKSSLDPEKWNSWARVRRPRIKGAVQYRLDRNGKEVKMPVLSDEVIPINPRLQDSRVLVVKNENKGAIRGEHFNPFPRYETSYDTPNPNSSSLSAWETYGVMNKNVSLDLVRVLNYDHSKKFGKHTDKVRAVKMRKYREVFELFNLCGYCGSPLKTKSHKIEMKAPKENVLIQKDRVRIIDGEIKTFKGSEMQSIKEVKLTPSDLVSYGSVKEEFADIPEHYEVIDFPIEIQILYANPLVFFLILLSNRTKKTIELVPARRLFLPKCSCQARTHSK